MQISSETKELLRQAWPHLYLSEVAALLSCKLGTAYRALEEARCFPKAPAGKPSKRTTLILENNQKLAEALKRKKITPRRYFHAIGCSIELLDTDINNEILKNNLSHDFPELYELPPIYHNQRSININYGFARSGLGWCCYSSTYQGLIGRGKTMKSAMYHADMAFKNISAKGRLKLFLEQGMQAALNWEPPKQGTSASAKSSEVQRSIETVGGKATQPAKASPASVIRQRSITEINREINQVEFAIKSIHPADPNGQALKKEHAHRLSKLKWEFMSVEHPVRYVAHVEVDKLRQKSAALLVATKKLRAEDKYDEADMLEDQFYQVDRQINELSKKLK
jgi:hypothetical protein